MSKNRHLRIHATSKNHQTESMSTKDAIDIKRGCLTENSKIMYLINTRDMIHKCGLEIGEYGDKASQGISGQAESETCNVNKPYICVVCDENFRYSGDLQEHLHIHTGEVMPHAREGDIHTGEVMPHAREGGIHTGEVMPHAREEGIHTGEVMPHAREEGIHTGEVMPHAREGDIHTGDVMPHAREGDILRGEVMSHAREVGGDVYTKRGSQGKQIHHPRNRPLECKICGKGFCQPKTMKKHMRIHTVEKKYECTICGRRFRRPHCIKAHMRIHTGEKKHKCEICGKRFSHLHNMKIHMRIHTGEKPYKCEVCSKRFRQISNMKTHMRIHTGEKPYKCEFCGKGFSQLANIQVHRRKHTGEKSYACDQCNQCFIQLSTFQAHKRTHTEGNPFTWNVNEKRCSVSNKLTYHHKANEDDVCKGEPEKHVCIVCERVFTRARALHDHMNVHTGNLPYKCTGCGKGFSFASTLGIHVRKCKHSISLDD